VAAGKPPRIEEQPPGSGGDQERGGEQSWQTNKQSRQTDPAQQPGSGAAVCAAVCAGRASGEGERAACSPPPVNSSSGHRPCRRYSSHGYHPLESCYQKECVDPDGGPTQERRCLGLRLQGVPEPGTRTGGQQRQQLCSVRPGTWFAQPGGRVGRGSGEVKEHPGL